MPGAPPPSSSVTSCFIRRTRTGPGSKTLEKVAVKMCLKPGLHGPTARPPSPSASPPPRVPVQARPLCTSLVSSYDSSRRCFSPVGFMCTSPKTHSGAGHKSLLYDGSSQTSLTLSRLPPPPPAAASPPPPREPPQPRPG